jgi:cytoskeletal protein CcmA (bactofilin family)
VQSNFRGQAVLGLAPDVWNVVAGGSVNSSNLVDVTGTPTDVDFSIKGVLGSINPGNGGLPLPPGTAGLLGYFDYVQNGAMTVTVSGLDPSTTYDVVVFTAGDQSGLGALLSGAISATNILTTRAAFVEGDNYARNTTANADPSGNIVFQVANDPNQTPYGTFNGLQIQNNRVEVKLRGVLSGGSLILTWPQGKLLESTTADGSFSLVPENPTSPYTVSPSANQKFYRVQVSP